MATAVKKKKATEVIGPEKNRVEAAFNRVRNTGLKQETIDNKADHTYSDDQIRFGETHRQGDIYITRIKNVPKDCAKIPTEVQLVPGSTMGSRHCLDGQSGIEMFKLNNPTALDGPILKTTREFSILHPEHGNVNLPPGCFKINYQRLFADELKRQRD